MSTEAGRVPPAWHGLFGVPLVVVLAFGLLTVVTAVLHGLPLRDPDGFLGPSYVRLPVIVALMMAGDVVPRVLRRRPAPRQLPGTIVDVLRRRWTGPRLAVVAAGLAGFYVAYVAYRNLKGFLPFLGESLWDPALMATDRWLTGGRHPADVLQQVLGTGVSAEVLSVVYLSFLVFVPFSLAVALLWSHDLARGAWYVSALCFNWVIGTATYYAVPSLGPVFVERQPFTDLPATAVEELQESLHHSRLVVLADPHATQFVQGIAAFASLHVSIVFTAALVAQLVRLPRMLRIGLWVYLVGTALATVYFGWHYVIDVPAGLAVGGLSVWLAARATGGSPRTRPAPGLRTGARAAALGHRPSRWTASGRSSGSTANSTRDHRGGSAPDPAGP